MVILKVTPVRNVLINKCCFKSENSDMFFCKVYKDGSKINVFDITDKKEKELLAREINIKRHRMIINDKNILFVQ